jgi:hypothetical protein
MNLFLKSLKYEEPVIKNYHDPVNDFRIIVNKDVNEAIVFSKGEKWLSHNSETQDSIWETFSHYWIAKGHCICTGLGLALRESWLLNKKEVTKVTVIENDEGVIEYHRINNPKLFKELEIIKTDANTYRGKCDTLLLDHYESEYYEDILNSVNLILNNISCDTMWFWPLEIILHTKYTRGDIDISVLHEGYNHIKKKFNLYKLPDISESLLGLFMISTSSVGFKPAITQEEQKMSMERKIKSWNRMELPKEIDYNPTL